MYMLVYVRVEWPTKGRFKSITMSSLRGFRYTPCSKSNVHFTKLLSAFPIPALNIIIIIIIIIIINVLLTAPKGATLVN